jgi:high-affinity nickel-transport protein
MIHSGCRGGARSTEPAPAWERDLAKPSKAPWTGRKGSGTITSLPVILLGFLLGMRHATDPDHVIAVATIVTRRRSARSAALIGGLWGIGHTATIMLVGGVIILFEVVIPPRMGLAMEFSVALMLILLGIASLSGLTARVTDALTPGTGPADGTHVHPHPHSDYVHTHPHGHEPGAHGHADAETPLSRVDRALGGLGAYQALRPLVVGLVHGLAGSAAVALLVLATIRNPLWAVAYLLLFGVGTMVGMMLITTVIALPLSYSAGRFAVVHRYLGLAAGLLSLGVGLVLAYQIGLVDGLFTSDPQWTPK